MRSVAWVAVLFVVAPPAFAEIFKCAGNGVIVYQNFRCELDSLGSLPSAPTSAGMTVPKTAAARAEAARTPTEPRVGMSAEEVRAIWGDPTDTFTEEPGAGARSEVWAYGSNRSVRFDHRSRVIAVRKQGGD